MEIKHFYDVLDTMVEKCPVVHGKVGSGYSLINCYEDVRRAGQDWRTFSMLPGAEDADGSVTGGADDRERESSAAGAGQGFHRRAVAVMGEVSP